MKKPLNIYEALFLVFLYQKINHPEFLNWPLVYSPLFLEGLHTIGGAILKQYGIDDRIRFFLWKIVMKRDLKKAAGKAKDIMKSAKPGNPGQFYDQQKVGKS